MDSLARLITSLLCCLDVVLRGASGCDCTLASGDRASFLMCSNGVLSRKRP